MREDQIPSQDPDISESIGAEDYVLGRPYRASAAPDPAAYSRGWSDAAQAEIEQHPTETGDVNEH
jgi:hypothetical protein